MAIAALALLWSQAARAEPMKCSGEEKVCTINCAKAARTAPSICLTQCGARKSECLKTGCWYDGTQRYCGLLRQ